MTLTDCRDQRVGRLKMGKLQQSLTVLDTQWVQSHGQLKLKESMSK